MLPLLRFFLDGLPLLLTPLLLLLASSAVGGAALRLLRAQNPKRPGGADLLDRLAAGLGLLSLAVYGLGLAGAISPPILAAVLGIPILLELGVRLRGGSFSSRFSLEGLRRAGPAAWSALAYLSLLILVDLFRVLVPPTFYDPLVQNLAFPAQWRVLGRVVFFPWNFQSGFPQGSEMLALIPLTFQGPGSAAVLEFLFGWLSVAAVFRLGREAAGSRAGLLAALIFASIPGIGFSMAAAKNDLALVFYEVLAVRALMRWKGGGRLEDLLRGGLFFGFALATKYLALFVIAAAILAILVFGPDLPWRPRRRVIAATILAALPLLITSPWLIRNLVATGNPVFPLLPSILDGPGWSPRQAALMARDTRHPSLVSWREILELPWRMSSDGKRLGAGGVLGPFYLALLPLFFFLRRLPESRNGAWLCLLGIASLVMGYTQTTLTRYHWAGFALLAVPAGLSACRVVTGGLGRVGVFLLALGLSSNLVFRIAIQELGIGGWDRMTGRVAREAFVAGRDPAYPAALWVNRHLPQSVRLLFIGETRWLYFDRPAVAPAAYDAPVFAQVVRASPDPAALAGRLRDMGITHLVLNLGEVERLTREYGGYSFTDGERQRVEAFFRSLPGVYRDAEIQIFALPVDQAWFTGRVRSSGGGSTGRAMGGRVASVAETQGINAR